MYYTSSSTSELLIDAFDKTIKNLEDHKAVYIKDLIKNGVVA
jgi:hypothetical protein